MYYLRNKSKENDATKNLESQILIQNFKNIWQSVIFDVKQDDNALNRLEFGYVLELLSEG